MIPADAVISCVAYTLIYLYCWFPLRSEIVENLRIASGNETSCANVPSEPLSSKSITATLLSGTIKAVIIALVIQLIIWFASLLSEYALSIDLKCYGEEAPMVFKSAFNGANGTCIPEPSLFEGVMSSSLGTDALGGKIPDIRSLDKGALGSLGKSGLPMDKIGQGLSNMKGLPDLGSLEGKLHKGGGEVYTIDQLTLDQKPKKPKPKKKKITMEERLSLAYTNALKMDVNENGDNEEDMFEDASSMYTKLSYNFQFALLALSACAVFTYLYERAVLPFIKCDYETLVTQANVICVINLFIYLFAIYYIFLTTRTGK